MAHMRHNNPKMVKAKQIQELVERIVRGFHPERVILFGSYAYGKPTADSDVDILVVMPLNGKKPVRQEAEIALAVHGGFPMDLIVQSPERLKQRIEMNDFFLREIAEKGKVLYDSAHERVG
jgi:predicted nucleotidyltransferase